MNALALKAFCYFLPDPEQQEHVSEPPRRS